MAEEAPEANGDQQAPPANLLGRVRTWSAGNPKRTMMIAAALGVSAVGTVVAWLAAADLAAGPEEATIELALRALDDGDNELAESLVEQMREAEIIDGGMGGPLFVLGAIKMREAVGQWSAERRRSDYYIASRYLSEARTFGFPEGREAQGLYLLGKSLIESRQLTAGIAALVDAMDAGAKGSAEAHLLLADAYFYSPTPKYEKSLAELDLALGEGSLDPESALVANLLRAQALSALGRHDEADAAVEQAPTEVAPAERRLVRGRVIVSRIEDKGSPSQTLAQTAERVLREARTLDKLATGVSRQSEYFLARLDELGGRNEEALARYDELRRSFGSSPAGIAAALAEGDMLRSRGEPDRAIESYRRVLDAMAELTEYRGTVLSISEIKTRLRQAYRGLIDSGDFEQAIELVNHMAPPFSMTRQLEFRSEAMRRWGDSLLAAAEERPRRAQALRRLGLEKLRAAGVAYEQLAEARYATDYFTDDLWQASDAYFRGQSYKSVARVLDRYLRNEPEERDALAHLRLGEAYLSMGMMRPAIDVFEECLDFHPDEGPSYRARVEGAKAHAALGEFDRAEELLRENLQGTTGNAMTPASPEWRDSLFELGRLMALQGRDKEAIDTLTEAIDRYPDDPQRKQATYLVAEAHRHAAREPLAMLSEAKTVNERERARDAAFAHLREALALYNLLQREITRSESQDALDRVTQRNCYMLGGAVLFQMGRYEEAISAYSNVSTLYQNEPFLLEAIVQISHCWRRLKDNVRAAGAVQQAKDLLARLPPEADFATSTNLSRNEWAQLLQELSEF